MDRRDVAEGDFGVAEGCASRGKRRPRLVRLAAIIPVVLAASWLSFLWARGAGPSAGAARAGGPVPVECVEPDWDCGLLQQDAIESQAHTFRLTNRTSKTVPIIRVATDCGCVVAKDPPRAVPAHGSCDVEIVAKPAALPGPFRKSIEVILGTEPTSKLSLTIGGAVAPCDSFYSTPEKLDFGELEQGQTRVRTIRIARYSGTPIRLVRVMPGSEAMRVDDVVSGGADTSVEVAIRLDGSTLKASESLRSHVLVQTSNEKFPEFAIPVVAKVTARAGGMAESIFIDRLAPGEIRDEPLASGPGPYPRVEGVTYEGDGPLKAELAAPGDSNFRAGIPSARVSRTRDRVAPRIYRGDLVVRLAGESEAVRIPLAAYLPD